MSHPDAPAPPAPPRRVATPAQQAASRANGARSRGPITPEGLARTRGNALKHGLSGQGIVLPPGLAAAAEDKFAAYCAALHPEDDLQRDLVRRAALAAVRLAHCARHEDAVLSERVRRAVAEWDQRIAAEVQQAAAALAQRPAEALAVLESSACGAAWLLDQWEELGRELDGQGYWADDSLDRALHLLGCDRRPDWRVDRELADLMRAALGACPAPDPAAVLRFLRRTPAEGAPAPDATAVRALLPPLETARADLAAFVALERERLEALRDALAEQVDAKARARAADLALFDPSPEAERLRRYDAALSRELHRALTTLERLRPAVDTPASRPAKPTASGGPDAPRQNGPGGVRLAPPRPQPPQQNGPGAVPPGPSPQPGGSPRAMLAATPAVAVSP